jgi:hypothetical protein
MFYRKVDGQGLISIKYGENNKDITWGRTLNVNLETLDMVISMINHHIQEESKNEKDDNSL